MKNIIRGFNLFEVILIIIIVAIISSITTGVIMLNNTNVYVDGGIINVDKDKNLQDFISVYKTLLSKYYDSNIDREGMLNAAEEAMVNYLGDKYTTYLNDKEYQDIVDDLSGTYDGIGIYIENNKIVEVLDDSPAKKAGLLAGDIITKINDKEIDLNNSENIGSIIKKMIQDENNIKMSVLRGEETVNFELKKENLINPSVEYKKIENTEIGYINIKKFSENLDVQVRKALEKLNAENLSSLIIDVRNNAGGYLSSAEKVSSLFLEKGKVIYSLESNLNNVSYYDKTDEMKTYKVVVLINGGSASASEILAAALKDSYGATLIGTKSYGKGKVQQVVSLNNGNSVKYTSAKWLTPKGVCIDGIGITPDIFVDYGIELETDNQLERAIEYLNSGE